VSSFIKNKRWVFRLLVILTASALIYLAAVPVASAWGGDPTLKEAIRLGGGGHGTPPPGSQEAKPTPPPG